MSFKFTKQFTFKECPLLMHPPLFGSQIFYDAKAHVSNGCRHTIQYVLPDQYNMTKNI